MNTQTIQTLDLTERRAEAYRDACADRGPIAFVAVSPDEKIDGINGAIGIAVANEIGYHPVPLGWARYSSLDAAQKHAEALNRHIGLSRAEEVKIIASTMGGRRYTPPAA